MASTTKGQKAARSRLTTVLIAVTSKRQDRAPSLTAVYAVMTRDAEGALSEIREAAGGAVTVALVGSLSSLIAKALKLKAGEARPI